MKSRGIDKDSLQEELKDLPLGGIIFKPEMSSTNDIALEWASKQAKDLSLVVTNHQTAGRGRKSNKWFSSPDSSLTISLIVFPEQLYSSRIGLYSGLGAMALINAIKTIEPGLDPKIKWPNDIFINRKKVGGILTEAVWMGDRVDRIIMGIGVNLDLNYIPPNDLVSQSATCMESILGYKVDKLDLLHKIISEILKIRRKIGSNWFIDTWEEMLEYRNEHVEIWEEGYPPKGGKIVGLTPEGGLLLQETNDNVILIHFGELHLRSTNRSI